MEKELLATILNEARIGLTLQHMGSYRELLMLKEQNKLTPATVSKLSLDNKQMEERVLRAKAIRHGVDEKWVRERM